MTGVCAGVCDLSMVTVWNAIVHNLSMVTPWSADVCNLSMVTAGSTSVHDQVGAVLVFMT